MKPNWAMFVALPTLVIGVEVALCQERAIGQPSSVWTTANLISRSYDSHVQESAAITAITTCPFCPW